MNRSFNLFVICFLFFFVSDLDAQSWPQYRGPEGTGKLTGVKFNVANKSLKVHWKVPSTLGFSSFAVSDGKAITLVGRDKQEVCIALDAETGKELWSQPLGSTNYESGGGNAGAQGNKGGDGPRSTPAISGNRVFVYDAHLTLHCLELNTGERVWSRNIEKDFSGKNIKWKNATSPLLDDDFVYVAGGGNRQSLLAFKQSDGKLKWKSESEKLTHASPAFANIHGKAQVIFFMQSGLIAVDRANGTKVWNADYPFNVSTAASPVVNDNMVYCSAGYGVGAGMFQILPNGGVKEVWRKPNRLINHWSSPVLHDGHLYGLYKFKRYGTAPLQCVDFVTGDIKWAQTGFGQGNCIVVENKIMVLSDAGELAIVKASPEKYDELWRGKVVDGKCWSTPAFSNGKIYIRSTKEAACISFE